MKKIVQWVSLLLVFILLTACSLPAGSSSGTVSGNPSLPEVSSAPVSTSPESTLPQSSTMPASSAPVSSEPEVIPDLSLQFEPTYEQLTFCDYAYIDADGVVHISPYLIENGGHDEADRAVLQELDGKSGAVALVPMTLSRFISPDRNRDVLLVLWSDGTISTSSAELNDELAQEQELRQIVSVSGSIYETQTVTRFYQIYAIRADGTCLDIQGIFGSPQPGETDSGKAEVVKRAGKYHSVAALYAPAHFLKADGSYSHSDVSWTGLVQLVNGATYTVGLRENGELEGVRANNAPLYGNPVGTLRPDVKNKRYTRLFPYAPQFAQTASGEILDLVSGTTVPAEGAVQLLAREYLAGEVFKTAVYALYEDGHVDIVSGNPADNWIGGAKNVRVPRKK